MQSLVGPLLAVSFVLVFAVHIPHVGVSVNGARRWIGSGPLQFQPSELLKLALVLYGAALLARRPQRVYDLHELFKPLLSVAAAACVLVATQPDLGTAMVIAFTTCALLVAAGIPARNLAIIAGSTLAIVALYAIARPYERARLTSFVNPWAHASGSGFQAVQGQIAIGSGGLFGVGPGQSVQKIFYLPEAHTDFILAVIGEELGVVGMFAVLFLYGLIAYAGLRAAKAARSLHSALIAVGMTSSDRLSGTAQRIRRAGARAAHRCALAVGLLRFEQSDRDARRDGSVVERRRRRHRPRACRSARRRRKPADEVARAARGSEGGAVADAQAREQARWGRERSAKRVVIAAGGTAGHVIPALAVADALRAEGAIVTFIGGERAEAQLVPDAGYPLRTISVEGLSRSNPLRPRAGLRAPRGATLAARGHCWPSSRRTRDGRWRLRGGAGRLGGSGTARPARADRGR